MIQSTQRTQRCGTEDCREPVKSFGLCTDHLQLNLRRQAAESMQLTSTDIKANKPPASTS